MLSAVHDDTIRSERRDKQCQNDEEDKGALSCEFLLHRHENNSLKCYLRCSDTTALCTESTLKREGRKRNWTEELGFELRPCFTPGF